MLKIHITEFYICFRYLIKIYLVPSALIKLEVKIVFKRKDLLLKILGLRFLKQDLSVRICLGLLIIRRTLYKIILISRLKTVTYFSCLQCKCHILESFVCRSPGYLSVEIAVIIYPGSNLIKRLTGIDLSFEKAAAIDLAGRNVLEAVKMSVNPKVIETPDISAVAKDGIELLVKARVTVRTNLERLVGGAGESTILARIGEGIVTTVGSSDSHKEVLENPDNISKLVLSKGLDSGTAFEILSIDIADIDVGRNIGAHLQSLQAEADKNIAQAKAEERRAMAVAKEQEMRATVVEAEAEVPRALAQALREGRLSVMDYYEMQNIQADTHMRDEIAGGSPSAGKLTEGDGNV